MSLALLSQQVIARIAAGEVIERPSSVVKELVENALDAGATQITVQVAGGGMETIHVADNGCGIAPDDLELAFERHATSKIAAFDDMFALSTLGFRGEALPSIVAVADVEITSCQDGAIGSKLEFRGGVVHKKSLHGRSQGTSISASHLFQSVPARLKFLKSRSSEESRIAQVLCQYALAYPEVKFSLICDGKEKLSTNGHGVLADVVLQIYGTEVARHLLSLEPFVSDEASSIRISGLVASPAVSRSNNSYISLFINRRWVTSRRLIYAVEEAYHGLLMTGRHPIAVINIVIAPDQVDVNIHPTKSEVKMSDESAVFGMVQRSVRQTLLQTAPVVSVTPSPAQSPTQIVSQADFLPKGAFGTVRNPVSVWPHDASLADEPYSALRATPRDALPALRLLGQVRNKYIVAEGPDGVYLID
ncbi:MAG: DNA mismatch repair endonuclease MutL, partial [Dehalococcoidia bacterium]|nr:DNA mismatch repair endonuclease MutL [Dehalococcoidia bacterium]